MFTRFKLVPKNDDHDLDLALFQQSLPEDFRVILHADGIYLEVITPITEDPTTHYRVDRELDRLYFLTRLRINAEMCTKILIASVRVVWGDRRNLPTDIKKQNWSYDLAVQLRLWAAASETIDPLAKIVLYFQVIEMTYPLREKTNYPPYTDTSVPPHPRTESKLLRHLIVHAGDIDSPQLKNYCDHLGLPPLMLDRTDPHYVKIVSDKISLVEKEARCAIEKML